MGAAATVLYVWSTVQEYAIALIIAVVILAIGVSLWRFDVLRKRRDEEKKLRGLYK